MPHFSFNLPAGGDALREAIRGQYRQDEAEAVAALLPVAALDAAAKARVWHRARRLVAGVRAAEAGQGGIGELLNEFSLSSQEGVVLMCLAEALLRVPDSRTADRLIRDKLEGGDWSSHLGRSGSLFVNASAWGLLLTGKLVRFSDRDGQEQAGLLKRTIARLGEPVVRAAITQAMRVMGGQFVMGQTIEAAIERAGPQERKGYRYSYDMLGEGARTMPDADRHCDAYLQAIRAIGRVADGKGPIAGPGISVKLSALHPRYQFAKRERALRELAPRLKELALAAKAADIGCTLDAEEADRLDLSLELIEALFADPALNGWEGIGLAVQAYQKRALPLIEWLRALAARTGRRMAVRLVKGAYWDAEIKRAQVAGHEGYPVFTRKPATDLSYQACARQLLDSRRWIYPQFASHNAYSLAAVLEMAGAPEGFELQRLHGMGEQLHDRILAEEGIPCRIYAPVGQHEDLLAYLVRRLLENGANTSFVHNILDDSVPIETLIEDPVEKVRSWSRIPHPRIPLPRDLYGAKRINAKGMDLTDVPTLQALQADLNLWAGGGLAPAPSGLAPAGSGDSINPANCQERLGRPAWVAEADLEPMLAAAAAAFPAWASWPAAQRAACLRRLADALEENCGPLMALCVKEAGKTLPDALAEVREAVDFCRYYADQAERLFAAHRLRPRGLMLCISPWNFPLAIFLGQLAAALAAGNAAIAKPAEQTCLIAEFAFRLLAQCGFPEGVAQLACCAGALAGRRLVPDERVAGVLFTGATETAALIARALAARPGPRVPLIAETGGQNAMIVDSTALSEQVVDDVIASGFLSAGQRCSALRVLFVQEDVADRVARMIAGAMRELRVGDPARLDTDLGPVIDGAALNRLEKHAQRMQRAGRLLHRCALSEDCEAGHFFAPQLHEIPSLDLLDREVFGPVVHLIRYPADRLDQVIDAVNATGYGLTLGVHSRIAALADWVARRARVGNVYVNRNMIGAVVGVQPFGGRGRSGTGPKAGGPDYLARLVLPDPQPAAASAARASRVDSSRPSAAMVADAQRRPPPARQPAEIDRCLARLAEGRESWATAPAVRRASLIRQFAGLAAARAPQFPGLGNLDELVRRCQQLAWQAERTLAEPETMPGPTGELNLLHREGRGILLCLHGEPFAALHWGTQIAAALIAGNCVLATAQAKDGALAQALLGCFREAGAGADLLALALPSGAAQMQALLMDARIQGVAIAPCLEQALACSRALARRAGELVPLIAAPFSPLYLNRFLTEKTVSVDTTAAGGNASLMTLEDAG